MHQSKPIETTRKLLQVIQRQMDLQSSKQCGTYVGHTGCMPGLSSPSFKTLVYRAKKRQHPTTILIMGTVFKNNEKNKIEMSMQIVTVGHPPTWQANMVPKPRIIWFTNILLMVSGYKSISIFSIQVNWSGNVKRKNTV